MSTAEKNDLSERPSKPSENPSAAEQLEPASRSRVENGVEQLLEKSDATGMEEENMLLLSNLGTLDREQQELVMNKLAEDDNVEVKRESITGDTVTKVVYENREGVDGFSPWIEFDMGTSEIEKVTAPHERLEKGFEDLDFLDEKIYDALERAAEEDPSLKGAALFRIGHAPTLIDDELGEELQDAYRRERTEEGFTEEEMDEKTVEKIRYSQHGDFWEKAEEYLEEELEGELDGDEYRSVLAGILGTASLQVSTQGQIEPYFEDVPEEDMRAFADGEETPETVKQAFNAYIRDFHGGGDYVGMTRLAPLVFYDERLSPEMGDGEMERVAARNKHYQHFEKAEAFEKLNFFDFPELDEVESNHDLTEMNANFILEFGPGAEAQHLYSTKTGLPLHMEYEDLDPEDEVTTVMSNREAERKSLAELLEDREAVATAKFEYDGEETDEEVVFDLDELMDVHQEDRENAGMTEDEEEFVEGLYEAATSGVWPHFRMRDGAGASFESRLPPATPRREESAYEQKAVLNGSLDLQQHFAEEYGVTHISHEEWQEIEEGIDREQGDYVVPFEVEGRFGETHEDVTVEELKYGSERVEGCIDVLEESLARAEGEITAAKWRQRKESMDPAYREFEQNYEERGILGAMLETKVETGQKDEYVEIEETGP